MIFTRSDPLDDASSPGGSELMGGASGSSAGGGANASSIDVAEGSSLGIPDEDLIGSDISIGRDDCKSVLSVSVVHCFVLWRAPIPIAAPDILHHQHMEGSGAML